MYVEPILGWERDAFSDIKPLNAISKKQMIRKTFWLIPTSIFQRRGSVGYRISEKDADPDLAR